MSEASQLDDVRAGRITLDQYLDAKVDAALAPYRKLPAADLAFMKEMLRDQLRTDPALLELIETATGRRPGPLRDP